MTLERTDNEILIRLPGNIDFSYLEDFLNYLNVKAILAKSEASEADIAALAKEVKSDWWAKNKSQFIDNEGDS